MRSAMTRREDILNLYRIEALELVPDALKVLREPAGKRRKRPARVAKKRSTDPRRMSDDSRTSGGQISNTANEVLQYRQQLAGLVPKALENLDVLLTPGAGQSVEELRRTSRWLLAVTQVAASKDDGPLLERHRQELLRRRPIAEEIQKVLEGCRGKVGKTIGKKQFEALLKEAHERGLRRAGMAKTDKLSGPK